MSKAPASASRESGAPHGRIPPLAVVIAANLASAHTTNQYLAALAALAVALTHDTVIHRR